MHDQPTVDRLAAATKEDTLDIRVIAHPQYEYLDRLRTGARDADRCQSFFRFPVVTASWVQNGAKVRVGPKAIEGAVRKRFPEGRSIVVTASRLMEDRNDRVACERRFVSSLSTFSWEASNEPPALATYFLFHFASAATNFAADLADDTIEQFAHDDPPVGCLFDWYEDYEELRRCMVAATICAQCEGNLAGMEMPSGAMSAVEAMLDRVRRVTIRRARDLPTRIFLGHGGQSSVWTEVKSRLEQFGLVVEEFNSESVAGEHVIRRLEDMLDRAVFGVLILSAEDEAHVASNSEAQKMATLRARQNVIHEAGLCQGRLGFRRVVLLREKGIEMPSNLAGLQDIPYDATSLTEAIAEIQRTLVREALIPAG